MPEALQLPPTSFPKRNPASQSIRKCTPSASREKGFSRAISANEWKVRGLPRNSLRPLGLWSVKVTWSHKVTGKNSSGRSAEGGMPRRVGRKRMRTVQELPTRRNISGNIGLRVFETIAIFVAPHHYGYVINSQAELKAKLKGCHKIGSLLGDQLIGNE